MVAGPALLSAMTRDEVETLAAPHHLTVFGVAPQGDHSVVLLGPAEPGFWPAFKQSPEWNDGAPDPMDRWSTRVIGGIAKQLNVKARFPFGDPPQPFLSWILGSGSAWQSPVGMMVHQDAGLMVSYRGALVVDKMDRPTAAPLPCTSCADQPCLTACPAGALTDIGYDVPACKAHLDRPDGAECLKGGCLVRRACPVSQTYARSFEQSAYHMQRFLE